MPQIAGTLDTYSARRQAEDVRDVIYTIAVKNKPFLSTVKTSDNVKAVRHEWQVDTLRQPAANAQIEGDDVTATAPPQPTVAANLCQISREQVRVSGTAQAVRLYGRKDEMKRQIKKKSEELARDIERAICATNQASVVGSSSVARQSASLPAWLTTNVSRGATGANGGFQSGTGLVNAATDGTPRALTETLYRTVMQACHTTGAMPTMAMMSPKDKVVFSSFAGIAVNRVDYDGDKAAHKQAMILAGADVYMGDFGKQVIVSNPFMSTAMNGRQRDAFLLDPNYAEVGYLRRMQREKLAKVADSEAEFMICEWTLVVTNEAAHGVIADLS
jgi:hypothetical protein